MQKPAVDAEDYPKVANTLAHWRFFGGVAGQPVKVGETVADVTVRTDPPRAAEHRRRGREADLCGRATITTCPPRPVRCASEHGQEYGPHELFHDRRPRR